jgi:hypothetical protein
MPRCQHCGFAHALPERCVNCGSRDPFARRRLLRLVALVVALAVSVSLGFYFYQRAVELRIAEDRARAAGDRFFETLPVSNVVEESDEGD